MYGSAVGRHGVCAAPERSLCEPKDEVIFDGPVRTPVERLLTLPSGLDNGAPLFTADGTQFHDESSSHRAVQPHPNDHDWHDHLSRDPPNLPLPRHRPRDDDHSRPP